MNASREKSLAGTSFASRVAILSAMIERITIAKFPEGVASNLTPRRGEDAEDFRQRLSRHHAAVLQARGQGKWRG